MKIESLQKQKKFSIIIPAYNASDYIERCVNSFVQQDLDYNDYEVIVINDGSTDNTQELVDNLRQSYSFLRCVTTKNRGLSLARNRGIQEAVGEYILFVDSDDCINPHVLNRIYVELHRDNLDIMLMNYQRLKGEQTLNIMYSMDGNCREVTTGMQMLEAGKFPPMVWCYAFNRDFLVRNQLQMKPMWHEDEEFTPRALYLANRVKYFPVLFYNYYSNGNSFMENYRQENMLYLIKAMTSIKHFIRSYDDKRGNAYFDHYIASYIMQYFKRSFKRHYTNQSAMIEEVEKGHLRPLKPRKGTFYTFLFNLSPALFVWYYKTFRVKSQQHE